MSRLIFTFTLLCAVGVAISALAGCAMAPTAGTEGPSAMIVCHEWNSGSDLSPDVDADGVEGADTGDAVDAVEEGIEAVPTAEEIPDATVAQPTVAKTRHETGLKFDARAWFAWVGPVQEDVIDKDTFLLPMYGGSLTWSPSFLPGWSFLLTVLSGSGEGDAQVRDGERFNADLDVDRLDVEFLARYSIPDHDAYVFAGVRWVDYEEETTWLVFNNKGESQFWVFELGAGAATEISEDGAHRLFANLAVGVGRHNWKWDSNRWPEERATGHSTEVSFDSNFGYQWAFDSSWDFSIRYRVFIITGESDYGMDTFTVFHGPELTLGFRF